MNAAANGQGNRILLVDDDQDVREVLSCALRSGGLVVSEAGNGAEALALFSESSFDLIITDFEMPTMKGDELVEKIRGLAPAQRIIMVSGNWWKPAVPSPKVNLCLDKPVQLPELLSAVHHVLNDPN
jgi:CheY-like chemotaxis protein